MAIQDNYLPEDTGLVTANLEILHKSTMDILKGSTTGDFELIEESQIQIEKSKKILKALHIKKIKRDDFLEINNEIYRRRGWLRQIRYFRG